LSHSLIVLDFLARYEQEQRSGLMPNGKSRAWRSTTTLWCGLALFMGCARSETSAGDVDLSRAQLDSLWSGLSAAMMAGDTSRLTAFYSDSAVFAETGTPTLAGLEKIKEAAAGVFACCRYLESRVRPEITEVSGGRAFQFGTYRDVIQPVGEAPITFYGRFSAIIDRGSANSWYVSRLMVVRDSTSPPLVAR
jgi:ketosteroid isomerase-like protein